MIRWQATRWDLTKLPFSVARKFWWGVISQILHHRAQASAGNSISFDHSEPALFCLINCPALGLDGAHTSSTPQPHSPSPSLMADLDTHVNSNLPASINSPPPQADTNPQVHPLFLHISDEEVWKLKPFEVRISSPNSDGTSPTIIGFDSNIYSIVYERDNTRSEETLLFSVESEKGEVLVIPRSFRTIRAADGKPSLTFPLIITTFHNKPPSEMEGSYLVAKSDHFYGRVQMKKFGKAVNTSASIVIDLDDETIATNSDTLTNGDSDITPDENENAKKRKFTIISCTHIDEKASVRGYCDACYEKAQTNKLSRSNEGGPNSTAQSPYVQQALQDTRSDWRRKRSSPDVQQALQDSTKPETPQQTQATSRLTSQQLQQLLHNQILLQEQLGIANQQLGHPHLTDVQKTSLISTIKSIQVQLTQYAQVLHQQWLHQAPESSASTKQPASPQPTTTQSKQPTQPAQASSNAQQEVPATTDTQQRRTQSQVNMQVPAHVIARETRLAAQQAAQHAAVQQAAQKEAAQQEAAQKAARHAAQQAAQHAAHQAALEASRRVHGSAPSTAQPIVTKENAPLHFHSHVPGMKKDQTPAQLQAQQARMIAYSRALVQTDEARRYFERNGDPKLTANGTLLEQFRRHMRADAANDAAGNHVQFGMTVEQIEQAQQSIRTALQSQITRQPQTTKQAAQQILAQPPYPQVHNQTTTTTTTTTTTATRQPIQYQQIPVRPTIQQATAAQKQQISPSSKQSSTKQRTRHAPSQPTPLQQPQQPQQPVTITLGQLHQEVQSQTQSRAFQYCHMKVLQHQMFLQQHIQQQVIRITAKNSTSIPTSPTTTSSAKNSLSSSGATVPVAAFASALTSALNQTNLHPTLPLTSTIPPLSATPPTTFQPGSPTTITPLTTSRPTSPATPFTTVSTSHPTTPTTESTMGSTTTTPTTTTTATMTTESTSAPEPMIASTKEISEPTTELTAEPTETTEPTTEPTTETTELTKEATTEPTKERTEPTLDLIQKSPEALGSLAANDVVMTDDGPTPTPATTKESSTTNNTTETSEPSKPTPLTDNKQPKIIINLKTNKSTQEAALPEPTSPIESTTPTPSDPQLTSSPPSTSQSTNDRPMTQLDDVNSNYPANFPSTQTTNSETQPTTPNANPVTNVVDSSSTTQPTTSSTSQTTTSSTTQPTASSPQSTTQPITPPTIQPATSSSQSTTKPTTSSTSQSTTRYTLDAWTMKIANCSELQWLKHTIDFYNYTENK